MDDVQDTRMSLHHNDIIIVPENEKIVGKDKFVNFEEPQKFIDEMKTAIQCWAGMKVTRYLLFITRARAYTSLCLNDYKFFVYKTFY